jgi:hypothetical protein
MVSKLPTIAGYLCVGLMIVSALAWHWRREGGSPLPKFHRRVVAVGALLVAMTFLLGSSPFPGLFAVACAFGSAFVAAWSAREAPYRIDWPAVAVLFLAFCLAMTLAWWRRKGPVVDISILEVMALQVPLIGATFALIGKGEGGYDNRFTWRAMQVTFFLVAVVVLFSTGLQDQPWMRWLSWHHWGAYIGPAQLARSGVRLLYDVPLQYGLGPTLTLALTCGTDCWRGMYFVVGVSSLLYAMIMLCIASRICGVGQSRFQIVLVGLLTFAALFVWTAYPPMLGSPVQTPSVSGLRFLPLALLMWVLIRNPEMQAVAKPPEAVHALWIFGILWSPESAFQVSVVWWPYYVWACCLRAGPAQLRRALILANVRLLSWLIGACIIFFLVYRVAYGVTPTFEGYFAYLLYPPGPLPIDPFGAVWFFGFVILAGIVGLHGQLTREPESPATHTLVVLLLSTYGVAAYFLGRSHDNNLLNISAFFVLLLLALRASGHPQLLRVAACGLLAALLAYPMLAGFTAWSDVASRGGVFRFRPHSVTSAFSYMDPRGGVANQSVGGPSVSDASSRDAATGMRTIEEQFHEPVTVIDPALNLEASSSGRPWSAYHGPENYAYFPAHLRRKFLANVAARLDTPGWLLVRRDYDGAAWLSDYDEVYRRDRTLDFGTYYAARYVPRGRAPQSP